MPCRRHAGAEVLYPLAASVPHGAGALFLMSGLKGPESGHVRLLLCASQKCESQKCESHHATRRNAIRRCARRSARRDGCRRRGREGLGGCEERDGREDREDREDPKVPLQRAPGTHEGFVRASSGPTGALGKGADAEYFIERRAADKEKARRRRSAGLRKSSCGRLSGREGSG